MILFIQDEEGDDSNKDVVNYCDATGFLFENNADENDVCVFAESTVQNDTKKICRQY